MSSSSKNSSAAGLFIAVVVIAALYLARVVFIPLALALLFSLLLTPVISFLERLRFPRLFAIFLVVITLLGLLGLGGWQISRQVIDLTQQLPTYKDTLEDKINSLRGSNSQSLNQASNTVHELEKDLVAATPGSSVATDTKRSSSALGSSPSKPMAVEVVPPVNPFESIENLLGPLVTIGVIAIFTIFILMGRGDLRNRFIRLAGGGRLSVMTQALDDATHRINRYLLLQLLVNVCYGIVIGVALHLIGIPNASLWGVGAAIIRFLPYIGPPLAAAMPILLSLAVFDGWSHALATMGVFFVLEVIVSNFVEPLLYGTHVGLSPLAVLVAAIFWTLIWGVPGLVLSTPITVCLVVMGRYVPRLGFLSVIFGDEPVLAPHVQYYQRLLATDPNEAKQVLEQYLKEKPVEDLYCSVVIPALSLAQQDRHQNGLDEQTQNFIFQSTREILEELDEPPSEDADGGKGRASSEISRVDSGDVGRTDIVCIPARDGADDAVAALLSQFLERRGHRARFIPIGSAPEMMAQVAEANPGMACISALQPFALNHARALYTKLRAQFPSLHIIVCLWHFPEDAQQTAARLRLSPGHEVFTTLAQVLAHIPTRAAQKLATAGEQA